MKFTCTVHLFNDDPTRYDVHCEGYQFYWLRSAKDISGEYVVEIEPGDMVLKSTLLRVGRDKSAMVDNDSGKIYDVSSKLIAAYALRNELLASMERWREAHVTK